MQEILATVKSLPEVGNSSGKAKEEQETTMLTLQTRTEILREPLPEEISYFRYSVHSPATDFANRIVVVAESDAYANQIFGV